MLFRHMRLIVVYLCLAFVLEVSADEHALRVGVTSNYPPVIYSADGVHAGIEIDLAKQLGKELKREITLVEVEWEQQIPALLGERTDIIMSGMSVTSERAKQVAFSDSYLTIGQMALTRREAAAHYSRMGSLFQITDRVGVVTGTTGDLFVKESIPGAQRVGFTTTDDGVAALRRGELDLFIHDAPTVWTVAGNPGEEQLMGLYRRLTDEPLAWSVRRQDQELLLRVNEILANWKRSGFLRKVLNRWIPTQVEIH